MCLKPNKVLSLIGLATKAGRVVSGEFSTEKAVKAGRASLVLVSEAASENTKKMFRNMCTYYAVPLYFYGEKEELGRATGKEERTSLALLDNGFAKAVEKQLMAQQTE
ncbi:MAG: 50S ribosomal protein L7ae [Lachnospiraceae bacterium]|nr:50S ribosomal protein L7ae [Lachnospiraceae bacterium]